MNWFVWTYNDGTEGIWGLVSAETNYRAKDKAYQYVKQKYDAEASLRNIHVRFYKEESDDFFDLSKYEM